MLRLAARRYSFFVDCFQRIPLVKRDRRFQYEQYQTFDRHPEFSVMSPPSGHGQQFNHTLTKTPTGSNFVPGAQKKAADQKNGEKLNELQKKMDDVGKKKAEKSKQNEKNQQMDETD